MKNQIRIRRINKKDKLDIFNWRNDAQSRNNSFSTKLISTSRHNIWFNENLKSKKSYSFIALLENNKIGFVHYEFKSRKVAYVSININPNYRKKGYGAKILKLSLSKIALTGYEGTIYAKIKKNNMSSISVFEKANYAKFRTYIEYILYKYNLKEERKLKMVNKRGGKNPKIIIDKIEKIRSKNNANWMDILRIAFKYSPKETSKVMAEIYAEDQKISALAKKLKKV